MKWIIKKIWCFIKKFLGIKPKVVVTPMPNPTPYPTPTITQPIGYWYVLEPAFITKDKVPYYSEMFYNYNTFAYNDRVLDKQGKMYTINGYVTQQPTDGVILYGIEKTLLK